MPGPHGHGRGGFGGPPGHGGPPHGGPGFGGCLFIISTTEAAEIYIKILN